ncbi:LOW QUALITY PROTEIN: maspardin [Kipferlia bialata]|uniref:Maspardin n=1 Tax=Kipferlia bialata TaxID=797122 RepID=A0A9K3CQN8_9EUKA|nr:LOW QUALITY PROTEIN: maspardin [Kipferlia bialata]
MTQHQGIICQKNTPCVILLPGFAETPDSLFRIALRLMDRGIRAVTVRYPVYHTVSELLVGMEQFIETLGASSISIVGIDVGAYIGQLYSEQRSHKVSALLLINPIPSGHYREMCTTFRHAGLMPEFVIKRAALSRLPQYVREDVVPYIDFLADRIDRLGRAEMVAQVRYTSDPSCVLGSGPSLASKRVMIAATLDHPDNMEPIETLHAKLFPRVSVTPIQTGSTFPHLVHPDEIEMLLLTLLRRHGLDTSFKANLWQGGDKASMAGAAEGERETQAEDAPAPLETKTEGEGEAEAEA